MTDFILTALIDQRDAQAAKLKKRENQPGYTANAADLRASISALDEEISARKALIAEEAPPVDPA